MLLLLLLLLFVVCVPTIKGLAPEFLMSNGCFLERAYIRPGRREDAEGILRDASEVRTEVILGSCISGSRARNQF